MLICKCRQVLDDPNMTPRFRLSEPVGTDHPYADSLVISGNVDEVADADAKAAERHALWIRKHQLHCPGDHQ